MNYNEKVNEISKEIGISELKFGDFNCIKNITHHYMKVAKRSNENYFNWMYAIGCHIKEKYNGGWVLVHYQGVDFNRHSCTVVNNKADIWQVGNFCYTIYFNKYRMRGIGFDTFYAMNVEQKIWKFKYTEINIPLDWFTFLEE